MTETAPTTAAHPTPKTYWIIALILALVTAVEVAIPYFGAPTELVVPSLLILGAVKFGIVVAFFMHLKFDRPLFRSLFLVGVIGAVPLFIVVLLTFGAL
jgi:cytochrome c oxidase subunit 4